jgi:hypothetical protein
MQVTYVLVCFVLALVALGFQAGPAHAANVENMQARCGARAAYALDVAADAVEVKYDGQRTDKTHAVIGSAVVRGQSRTFQCSFDPNGKRIVKFVVNAE